MVSEHELQALVEFTSDDPPTLSVYLNVDPTRRTKEEYRLTLRNLLKQAGRLASPKDLHAVEKYLDVEYPGNARGLIMFSCQDRGLWKVFPLAVPVPDHVAVARRPYITPLQDILDEYARYGVVLVDKQGARLFLFDLGELREVAGTLGGELRRHKQGGRASARLQRKADEIASQNLREAAEATRRFCEENHIKHLVLAGTDETLAIFRPMLPKAMQDTVVGQTPMDMFANEVEVRDKTFEIISHYLHREEDQLVARMITAAAKGEAGAIGLADTLNALQEDRVHILLVAEGFRAPGARCSHCGHLSADIPKKCRFCGGAISAEEDIVEAAVRLAIEKGVHVRIVVGNESLQRAGGIGAILRY